MIIKICGITNFYDASLASEAGADVLGLVFYEKSPRKICKDKALMLCGQFKKRSIAWAGVFVNEAPDRVLSIAKALNLSYLQFCGNEDTEYIKRIREKDCPIKKENSDFFHRKIIKTCKVKKNQKTFLEEIELFKDHVDLILLDHFSKKVQGGTGKPLQWELLKDIGTQYPVILSGGLDAANVKKASSIVKPCGVDASSKLESYPGKKDSKKVIDFINAVREIKAYA